jgi:hypothetical protein
MSSGAARVDLAQTSPEAWSSQLRDSAGMALADSTGFALWRAISLQADDRPG